MLTHEQVADFHRNGFLNGGRVLDDAEVQELRDELQRVLDTGPEGFPEGGPRPVLFHNMVSEREPERCVWQIVNIWEVSDAYHRLIHHPAIVETISRLTEADELMVWHDQIQYKPPGYGGVTSWHQDAPLWPIIRPMTPVSAWVALDDATVENGCMWMTPGSHRWGNQIEFLRTQAHFEAGRGLRTDRGLHAARRCRDYNRGTPSVAGEGRGGFVPPLADLARFALQPVSTAEARHRHALHDRRVPLRRIGTTRHEGLCRLAGWSAHEPGGRAFPLRDEKR